MRNILISKEAPRPGMIRVRGVSFSISGLGPLYSFLGDFQPLYCVFMGITDH
jgi:hypothetical protein